MVQPLWAPVWLFSENLPGAALDFRKLSLGPIPKEMESGSQMDVCILLFAVAFS